MKTCMIVANDMVYDSRVDRHAETLGMNGYEVTVLCVHTSRAVQEERRPHYSIVRKRDFLRRLIEVRMRAKAEGRAASRAAKASEVSVLRSLTRALVRLALAVTFDVSMIRAAKRTNADLYVCNDLDTLRVGVFMKLLGRRVVYDAHELYSDLFTETPPHMRRLLRQLEALFIRFADLVITVNEFIASEMSSRYNIQPPTVIMNCPKTLAIPTHPRESARKLRVALYQGGFVRERGLENVVLACKYLRNGISVVLRGEGSIEARLRELASNLGNCVFEMPVPLSEVVARAAEADVGIVTYLPTTLNNLYASPNKLFEYLQAGLPLVGSNLPFIRKMIVENDVGLVFDPNNPEDIARAINSVAQDEVYERLRMNVEKIKGKFSWEAESRKLLSAISALGPVGYRDEKEKTSEI